MTDLIVGAGLLLAAFGVLLMIIYGKFSGRANSFAALTAFHDAQPRDRREAIEVVIERKAGKRWSAEDSGQGTDGEVTEPSMDRQSDPENNNDQLQ